MDIYEFLNVLNESIFGGESSISKINIFVDNCIRYSILLASAIMIILVTSKVITYFMNPGGNMDPYILVKPVLILAALNLYEPLVDLLLYTPVDIVTDIVETAAMRTVNAPDIDSFLRLVNSGLVAIKDVATGEADIGTIYDYLQLSTFLELFHLLVQIAALLVNGYLIMRQLLLKAVYYILGVLVLPLSLIPSNFDVLKSWFFGFLSILLWIPIIRIFQTMIVLIHQAPVTGLVQPLFSMVLQIVMIMFLLAAPKYANFLVSGNGDSDSSWFIWGATREVYMKVNPFRVGNRRGRRKGQGQSST